MTTSSVEDELIPETTDLDLAAIDDEVSEALAGFNVARGASNDISKGLKGEIQHAMGLWNFYRDLCGLNPVELAAGSSDEHIIADLVGRMFVVREESGDRSVGEGLESLRDRVVDALRSRAAICTNTWSASGFVRLGIIGRVRSLVERFDIKLLSDFSAK